MPPVVPVVHLLTGFSYRLQNETSVHLDVGFRDVLFVGLGGSYLF